MDADAVALRESVLVFHYSRLTGLSRLMKLAASSSLSGADLRSSTMLSRRVTISRYIGPARSAGGKSGLPYSGNDNGGHHRSRCVSVFSTWRQCLCLFISNDYVLDQ